MVRNALDGAIADSKSSERATVAAVGAGADLTQVVTSVAEAETTLQTIAAVRDRVIEAYKDIMRMPI
jgi:flagellar hook-basal body complex protein FliE